MCTGRSWLLRRVYLSGGGQRETPEENKAALMLPGNRSRRICPWPTAEHT